MSNIRHWRLFLIGWILVLSGGLLAWLIQTSGGIKVEDVRFSGAGGKTLSALLYTPPNASAANPAPGILAVHGYINSREVQSGFAIEFARRGYVVLAMDQAGHGYSDGPAFAGGFGGPAGLSYLRSLEIVDPDNIGLEGHSMGGWTVLAAAAAFPDAYRSVVLQGSSTGSGMAAPGTAQWPRNVAVVFAQFDEFAPLMWEVSRGQDVASSSKLQALFGTDAPVEEGRIYGDIAAGTARVLHSPAVTHPGNHISHASIAHAIDWFGRTLEGGTPQAVSGQIWFAREIGTLIALIGLVLVLLGAFPGLLSLPWFRQLQHYPESYAFSRRSTAWWLLFLLSAAIPVLSFYPFMGLGARLLPASAWFPQTISSQVAAWAVLNGLIFTVVAAVLPRLMPVGQPRFRHRLLPSLAIAVLVVLVGYLAVVVLHLLFTVDARFWFVGVKMMSAAQWQIMLLYLPLFTVFFVLALRALHAGLSVQDDSRLLHYGSSALALMGGFLLFLILQYASLFLRGILLTPAEPLNTIVMIQFVPLLLIVALISTQAYRRTSSYLPGAFISALFVSWYIVAGQATHYAG